MKEVVLYWNDEMENLENMERESMNMKNIIEEYEGDCYDEKDEENEMIGGDIDVCPICLNTFTLPCRSNCGHLFCAACILQFWMYKESMEACKCPLCCRRIVKLQAQQSADDDGVDHELLKKLQNYNALYISGVFGLLHIVQALPVVMGRILRVVVDPDCLRCIYYVLRLVGLFLGLLYEGAEFEFVPAGGLGIQRMLEVVASLLVAALFLIGVLYRWLLKRRRALHFTAHQ